MMLEFRCGNYILRRSEQIVLKLTYTQLPWRNWLARSAVNRKVGGSSLPGSGHQLLFICLNKSCAWYELTFYELIFSV